jgi:hypothetical protein
LAHNDEPLSELQLEKLGVARSMKLFRIRDQYHHHCRKEQRKRDSYSYKHFDWDKVIQKEFGEEIREAEYHLHREGAENLGNKNKESDEESEVASE